MDKDIDKNHILYLWEAEEVALEGQDGNKDSFHTINKRQGCNKALDQRKKPKVEERHSFVGTSVRRNGFEEEGPKHIVPSHLVPAEEFMAWVKVGNKQFLVVVLAEKEQFKRIEQRNCNKFWKMMEEAVTARLVIVLHLV